jgi:hypothetical protein
MTGTMTHEQMHQMMDIMHGEDTSQRMHDAMGEDAERLMEQCVAMMNNADGARYAGRSRAGQRRSQPDDGMREIRNRIMGRYGETTTRGGEARAYIYYPKFTQEEFVSRRPRRAEALPPTLNRRSGKPMHRTLGSRLRGWEVATRGSWPRSALTGG